MNRRFAVTLAVFSLGLRLSAVPVLVQPVTARHGMVVAGHPEAASIGVSVLEAGGNAVDAAVAVSLALGVAEPYASGLGGKIVLLYHDGRTGRTTAIEAMDEAGGGVKPDGYAKMPADAHRFGWTSVCVPGLAAGLWAAHSSWGARPWAEDVAPAITLARTGAAVLPKSRERFEEKEDVLRRGDPEIARLYLPGGNFPDVGTRLPNADLASTLELLARGGADAFYRGPIAAAIVAASGKGGGFLRAQDFAGYEARVEPPIEVSWRGLEIAGGPPPSTGASLVLAMLEALEPVKWDGRLRSAENMALIGRVWQQVQPEVARSIADVPGSRDSFQKLISPDFVACIRRAAGIGSPAVVTPDRGPALRDRPADPRSDFEPEPVDASTTHFIVVDARGNVVCATQSLSLHFGSGIVVPGTGILMNDSMSNFAFSNRRSVNYVAPGKRPRSTITPTLVLREGRAILALGIPGGQRIPTAVAQVLLDHFAFRRSLEDAIGDTRLHLRSPYTDRDPNNVFEVEASLAPGVETGLEAMGWKVERMEAAGTGRQFGGLNAVSLNLDGTFTGYADPRRTNAAMGY